MFSHIRPFWLAAALLAAPRSIFHHAAAQVTTNCSPLTNTSCPADPALGSEHTFYFNTTPSVDLWEATAGEVLYSVDNSAMFTINKQGDSPTIRTMFYIFFGRVEVWLKASPGTGIISSVMLLSDVLDEVDWEFLGGNTTHVSTNYFGKGELDYKNADYHPVEGSTHDEYHNYTTVWTKERLDFYVNGNNVRTLLPESANNSRNYPQTPSRLSIGIWAGGDPTLPEGTREWAGGDTDYSKAPFTMYVKSAMITDFSSGKEYKYGDQTGSWESIDIIKGASAANETINKESEPTLGEKFNRLPAAAKSAVYASSAIFGCALIALGIFYFIRQRRRGARLGAEAEEQANAERMELNGYSSTTHSKGYTKINSEQDSFVVQNTEYHPKAFLDSVAKEMR